MRNNIYWGLLLVAVCAVFCGCAMEKPKPDPDDYDVDKVVAELVESTKHYRKEPVADKPKRIKNKQKPLANKEERLSSFGFGLYPEIPEGFPRPDYFTQHGKLSRGHELMGRVWVELWNRGVRGISGMTISNDTEMVYPTIKGVVYANWMPKWEFLGIGFGSRITRLKGHPEDKIGHPMPPGQGELAIPQDIKVFHISEGIDPYLLLKIPKE